MGKQFNFLIDTETEEKFIEFVKQCGGKILFEGSNQKPIEIEELPEQFSGKGWFSVLLYKQTFGELHYIKLENGRWFINTSRSPVIEFTRTVVRESQTEVSQGRLWLEMRYWDDSDIIQYKSKELDEWYKELVKWIKRNVKGLK